MSEQERGAYAPPTADAPLKFDARQPVRGSRPFPLTLVLSGLVLLGLMAAIFVFYRSGVRAAGEGPRTIGEPVGALKAAPPADAQPRDPAAGLQIYQAEAGQPASAAPPPTPQFVAPPEQPAARPTAPVAAVPLPPAAPAPVAAAPAPSAAPALRPAPTPSLAPAPQPAAPKPVAAQPKPSAPGAQPAAPRPVAPQPKPAVAQRPPMAEKPASAPAVSNGGAVSVQIGAVSSLALADKTWSEAAAAAPGLAAGKGKGVERIEKNGQTLYRTAVTGFASKADAAAFCARLKAAGKACFVR